MMRIENGIRMRSPMEQFELVPRGSEAIRDRIGGTGVAGGRVEGRVERTGASQYARMRGRRVERVGKGMVKVTHGAYRGGVGRRRGMGRGEVGIGDKVLHGRVRTWAREGREGATVERRAQSRGIRGEGRVEVRKPRMEGVRRINRRGIVPYSYSRTAQLAVTRTRARTVWRWKRNLGRKYHGMEVRGRLRPEGTPLGMVPIRVGLELRGFVITTVSLAVRLFANRMAGHILLKVLGGFGWVIMQGSERRGRLPRVVVRMLVVLETAVACIQAYVFALLRSIYVADMRKGGH